MIDPQVSGIPAGYANCLPDIETGQRAVRAVNAKLLRLYWQIDRDILDRQTSQTSCSRVIDHLTREPLLASQLSVEHLTRELAPKSCGLLTEAQP